MFKRKKTFLAPIVLFVYNRLWHTRQTIEALRQNDLASESELFIFSDGPKNENEVLKVQEIREYLKTIDGFRRITIQERNRNLGLAESIITGVTKIVDEYGKIIVLEDDLVTSQYFLKYMNDGLNLYQHYNSVASIHGYIWPIRTDRETFFIRGTACWGWATWERAWRHFESNGKLLLTELEEKNLSAQFDFGNTYPYKQMLINQIASKNHSWAVRWYASIFLKNMFTLYSGVSHVQNIGNDNSGIHSNKTDDYNVVLAINYNGINKIDVKVSDDIQRELEEYFLSLAPTFLVKIKTKIKNTLI